MMPELVGVPKFNADVKAKWQIFPVLSQQPVSLEHVHLRIER